VNVHVWPCRPMTAIPSEWGTLGWRMGSHHQTRNLRGQVHHMCMPRVQVQVHACITCECHVCMPRVKATCRYPATRCMLNLQNRTCHPAHAHALPRVHPARAGGMKRHRQHASTNSKAGFRARVLPLAAWLSANTGGRAGWSSDPNPKPNPDSNPDPNPIPNPNPNPNPSEGWSCDSGGGI